MKRVALCILAVLWFLGAPRSARAQGNGVVVISVTNVSANITVDRDCNYVVIRENSASPTAIFSITLANTTTALNYAAGSQFQFTAQKAQFGSAGTFKSGTTIGTIVATTAGPFSFTAVESYGEPSLSVKSSSGGSGGGDTTAEYVIGATDATLTNSAVRSDLWGSPDVPPASPTAYDCEFTSSACSFTTWGNQGAATTTVAMDHLVLQSDPGVGGAAAFVGEAVPSPTYQFDAKMCNDGGVGANYFIGGLALYESATGKVEWIGWYTGANITEGFGTLSGGVNNSIQQVGVNSLCMYARVKVDSTNITWSFSGDGVTYGLASVAHAKTTHFTTGPNYIGFVLASYGSTDFLSVDRIRRSL